MVDLPIPAVQPVLTDLPASSVSGSVFQRPRSVGIGDGLQAISEGVDALAQKAAAIKGREDASAALQRKADGSLEPIASSEDHFIFGNAGRAYEQAFNVGALAGVQTNIDQKAVELRDQFRGDPQGFKVAMGKYADGVRANYSGALGQAAFNHAIQVASQHYISSVEEKNNATLKSNYDDTLTRIADGRTQLGNVARGTMSDSTDFIGKSQEWQEVEAYYRSLGDNPIYARTWTPTKVESELRQVRQEAINDWAVGNAQRIRDRDGIDAAVKWSERNVRDSESNMPYNERLGAHNMVLARIASLTEEQKAQARASSAAVNSLAGLYEKDTPPTQEQFDAVLDSARRSFDVDGVAKLQAYKDSYDRSIKIVAPLSPREGVGALMGGSLGGDYFDNLFAQESGGRAAAKSDTSSAGGLAGFTEPTWNDLARRHPELFLTPGKGRFDEEQTKRAARVFTAENQTALAQAGLPANDRNTYMAHFLGAPGAVRFLKGMQANPDAQAIDYVSGDAAAANKKIFFDGERPRSLAEVYGLQTKRFGGAPAFAGAGSPIPFSGEEIRNNPWLVSAAAQRFVSDSSRQIQFAKDQSELIGKAVSMGAPPDIERVAQVIQIAQQHPQELGEVATKMRAQVAAAPLAMEAAGHPDGGASYIAAAEDLARRSPDLYHLSFAAALRSQIEGRAKALADDPHAYAARSDVGWLKSKPVPFEAVADPGSIGAENPAQALQAAVLQRREAGFRLAPRLGVSPEQAMFTPGDVKSVASLLQRSDGAGASMILRGLEGSLRPEELQTLARNNDFTNAVAGLARSGDPGKAGAAYGFLDKQWRENPEAFKKEFGSDMATKLAVWQDKIAFMTPDDAVRALQRANDPSTARAMDGLREQADKDTKDWTPDAVVSKAFGSIIPFRTPGAPVSFDANASGAAMLAETRAAYRDLYAESGDKSLAEARAVERVKMKWGASDVNGGRVMAYPPERYYPADINGSHAYVAAQLSDAVEEAAARYHGGDLTPQKMRGAERALVSDALTQEDIANRKPPRYRVMVKDDRGMWLPLEAAPGVPLRFRADAGVVEAGKEKARLSRLNAGMQQGPY